MERLEAGHVVFRVMRLEETLGKKGVGQVEVVGLSVTGELIVGYIGLLKWSAVVYVVLGCKSETGGGGLCRREGNM